MSLARHTRRTEQIWRMVMDTHLLKSYSCRACPVELTKVYLSLYISLEPAEHSDIYRSMFSPHHMKCKILSVVASIEKGAVNMASPFVVRFAGRIAAAPSAFRGDSWLGIFSPTPSSA